MIIALEKKKSNIAEYLLYMWQLEDLMRACQLDAQQVEERLVARFDVAPAQRAEIRQWYLNLLEMMHIEGLRQTGHLQINKNTLIDLADLHARLLSSPEHQAYQQLFGQCLLLLDEFRHKAQLGAITDVEVLFHALYTQLLMNLQKRTLSPETQVAMRSFTQLAAQLAHEYHRREQGELDI